MSNGPPEAEMSSLLADATSTATMSLRHDRHPPNRPPSQLAHPAMLRVSVQHAIAEGLVQHVLVIPVGCRVSPPLPPAMMMTTTMMLSTAQAAARRRIRKWRMRRHRSPRIEAAKQLCIRGSPAVGVCAVRCDIMAGTFKNVMPPLTTMMPGLHPRSRKNC